MEKKILSLVLILCLIIGLQMTFADTINGDTEFPQELTIEEMDSIVAASEDGISFEVEGESKSRAIEFPSIFQIDINWSGTATAKAKGHVEGGPVDNISGSMQLYRLENSVWKPLLNAQYWSENNITSAAGVLTFMSMYHYMWPGEEFGCIISVTVTDNGNPPMTQQLGKTYSN